MARKKKSVAQPPLAVEQVKETRNELDSLREFVAEAEVVDLLTKQPGWGIIERDLIQYKQDIGQKLAYLNPREKEFYEARVLFLAADKLLSLFRDYAENRKRAVELLEKVDNPQDNIVLDVDNRF